MLDILGYPGRVLPVLAHRERGRDVPCAEDHPVLLRERVRERAAGDRQVAEKVPLIGLERRQRSRYEDSAVVGQGEVTEPV